MKKKIVSIILALVLVVSLQIPMAFAAASTLEIALNTEDYSAGDQIQATINGSANANIISVNYYLDGEKVSTLTPSEKSFSQAVSFGIATTEPQVLEARMIEEDGTITRIAKNLAKRSTYENILRDLEATSATDVSTLAAAGLVSNATSRPITVIDASAKVADLGYCYAIEPTANGQVNAYTLTLPKEATEGNVTFKLGFTSQFTDSTNPVGTDNMINYAICINGVPNNDTWLTDSDESTLIYTNYSQQSAQIGFWNYKTPTETLTTPADSSKNKRYYEMEVNINLDTDKYSFNIVDVLDSNKVVAAVNNVDLPMSLDGIESLSLRTRNYKKGGTTNPIYYTYLKYMKATQEKATPDVEAITANGISQTSLDASSNSLTVNSVTLDTAAVNDAVTSDVNFTTGITTDSIATALKNNNISLELGGAAAPVIQQGRKTAAGESIVPDTLYIESGSSNSTPVLEFTPKTSITGGIINFGITYYGARSDSGGTSTTGSQYTTSIPELSIIGKDALGNVINRKLIYRDSTGAGTTNVDMNLTWAHKQDGEVVTTEGTSTSYTAIGLYNWVVSINLDNGTYSFKVTDKRNTTSPQNTSASNLTLPDDFAEITAVKFAHRLKNTGTGANAVHLEIRDFSLVNKKSYIEGLESTLSVAGDAATFTLSETPTAGNWYNLYLGGTKAKVKFAPASFQIEEHIKVTVGEENKVLTFFKNTENTAKSAVVLSAQNGLIQNVNLLNSSIAANSEKAVITALPTDGKVMVWDGLTKLVPLTPAAE